MKRKNRTETGAETSAENQRGNQDQGGNAGTVGTENENGISAEKPAVVTNAMRKPHRYPAHRKSTPRTNLHFTPDAETNDACINHAIELGMLPAIIDRNDADAVNQRVAEFFRITAKYGMKPSVVGLGLALGVHRTEVWKWANGIEQYGKLNAESRYAVKKAYDMLNLQMEDYMLNGKVNPVTGIFLSKNHFGYRDQTEQIIVSGEAESVDADAIRERYLKD